MATPPPGSKPNTPPADNYIVGTNTLPSNPTPLSAPQEQQVRDIYYKSVRAKCATEIEGASPRACRPLPQPTNMPPAFAQCALGRTVTMIYACREPRLAMNSCMLQYQNQDELDKARAQWFQLAGERKAARQEHARKLLDAQSKHKEWWNLDDSGRLQGKRLDEGGEGVKRVDESGKTDSQGVRRGGVWGGT
jgi:COX assembly protein 1